MIQGGYDEDQKKIQTRMYGTQGTHFLTNLVSNNIVYGFIMPVQDRIEPWFFVPPDTNSATYVLRFPQAVSVYADAQNQRCVVMSETA